MTNSNRLRILVTAAIFLCIIGASPCTYAEGVSFVRNESVFYMSGLGQAALRISNGESPTLSPDGHRIAYCINRSSVAKCAIAVTDITTRKATIILRPHEIVYKLVWSPVADRLAYIALTKSGEYELVTMRADGSDLRKALTSGKSKVGFMFSPTWAGDGESIYFHNNETLYRVNLSGAILSSTPLPTIAGKKNSITSTDMFVFSPKSSQLLAFTQSVPGTPLFDKEMGEPNTALYIYNTASKVRKRLTPIDLLAYSPSWSKDGRYLYFCGYRDRQYNERYPFRVYRIGIDGKGLTELCKGEDPSS